MAAVTVDAPDEPIVLAQGGSSVDLPDGLLMILVNGDGSWTIAPAD
ncbi:hypothetical protein [Actinobaculum sp. 313]|nr:hypothetical protein [Actinobaculum sp. 313]